MLAEFLSKNLGYRCVDRDVIVERAAAHDVSQEELHAALQKPPTFLERIQHKKYLYLVLIQAALIEEVRSIFFSFILHMISSFSSPNFGSNIAVTIQ